MSADLMPLTVEEIALLLILYERQPDDYERRIRTRTMRRLCTTAQSAAAKDAENIGLREELVKANNQSDHFERLWYLRGDKIEAKDAEVAELRKLIEEADETDSRKTAMLAAFSAEATEMRQRAERAEADARRYRWLRELPNADSLNLRFMGTDLDGIIDASLRDDALVASQPPAEGGKA